MPDQILVVTEEIKARKLCEAREGVKKPRETREWREKISEARAAYRPRGTLLKALDKIAVGWALCWYYIDREYRRLSAMNRS